VGFLKIENKSSATDYLNKIAIEELGLILKSLDLHPKLKKCEKKI